MLVTVRYFAGAAAAAGLSEEKVEVPEGADVAALAATLAALHGPALERVLTAATFLVDEVSASPAQTLPADASVDVLPPFAGG